MRVQLPVVLEPPRRGVPTRAVRERRIEQPVEARQHCLERVGKTLCLVRRQVEQRCHRAAWQHDGFVRPVGPVRDRHNPVVVDMDDPVTGRQFALHVIDEQMTPVLGPVRTLFGEFCGDLVWQEVRCPNLTVRVRIRRPRDRSARLENLHVFVPIE